MRQRSAQTETAPRAPRRASLRMSRRRSAQSNDCCVCALMSTLLLPFTKSYGTLQPNGPHARPLLTHALLTGSRTAEIRAQRTKEIPKEKDSLFSPRPTNRACVIPCRPPQRNTGIHAIAHTAVSSWSAVASPRPALMTPANRSIGPICDSGRTRWTDHAIPASPRSPSPRAVRRPVQRGTVRPPSPSDRATQQVRPHNQSAHAARQTAQPDPPHNTACTNAADQHAQRCPSAHTHAIRQPAALGLPLRSRRTRAAACRCPCRRAS